MQWIVDSASSWFDKNGARVTLPRTNQNVSAESVNASANNRAMFNGLLKPNAAKSPAAKLLEEKIAAKMTLNCQNIGKERLHLQTGSASINCETMQSNRSLHSLRNLQAQGQSSADSNDKFAAVAQRLQETSHLEENSFLEIKNENATYCHIEEDRSMEPHQSSQPSIYKTEECIFADELNHSSPSEAASNRERTRGKKKKKSKKLPPTEEPSSAALRNKHDKSKKPKSKENAEEVCNPKEEKDASFLTKETEGEHEECKGCGDPTNNSMNGGYSSAEAGLSASSAVTPKPQCSTSVDEFNSALQQTLQKALACPGTKLKLKIKPGTNTNGAQSAEKVVIKVSTKKDNESNVAICGNRKIKLDAPHSFFNDTGCSERTSDRYANEGKNFMCNNYPSSPNICHPPSNSYSEQYRSMVEKGVSYLRRGGICAPVIPPTYSGMTCDYGSIHFRDRPYFMPNTSHCYPCNNDPALINYEDGIMYGGIPRDHTSANLMHHDISPQNASLQPVQKNNLAQQQEKLVKFKANKKTKKVGSVPNNNTPAQPQPESTGSRSIKTSEAASLANNSSKTRPASNTSRAKALRCEGTNEQVAANAKTTNNTMKADNSSFRKEGKNQDVLLQNNRSNSASIPKCRISKKKV